ncbi:MAG: TraR/DksA C4-type zinc finger protein [Chloroflexota bacterium]
MDEPDAPLPPREILTVERERVLAEISGLTIEGPGQMTYGSQAAAATHVFEQQRDLALRDHARAHLAAIEDALRRLDAGAFGRCTACGRDIAPERLEAVPWAALCIDCQRAKGRR